MRQTSNSSFFRLPIPVVCLALLLFAQVAPAAEPRVLLEGAKLELIASEPDLVTPVGISFDNQGRLLVIESHTHQRPDNYEGPAGDRIKMFADSDADGKLDKWTIFAEGFQQAMNVLAVNDWVYVVTRRDVTRHRDSDGDGKADEQETILTLETEGDYPHNGLAGIMLYGLDEGLLIGLGENFGFDYTLVGSDGKRLSGSGGVGCIFECGLDGSELARLAVGFWNPFSICAINDAPGQIPFIFTVDNDPDASPPCRLINVVPNGDYGHRWEYGRAGIHPLQAWDGELPGTLPMVCGTGEAPTAVVPHSGHLWVTSWGDHRIERYRLQQRGMSFSAKLEIAVQGDTDFRPTGMAVAPDGSLYFADWVDRNYAVHGKGRLWRLSLPKSEQEETFGTFLTTDLDIDSADPFERHYAQYTTSYYPFSETSDSENVDSANMVDAFRSLASPNDRLGFLEQCHWELPTAEPTELLKAALEDQNANVRLYAVRWIADGKIKTLHDEVARLLEGELPTERYYLTVLSAVDWLDGKGGPQDKGIADRVLVAELTNEARPPAIRALALRLMSPDQEALSPPVLTKLLDSDSPELKLEAVRTLSSQTKGYRLSKLAEIAGDSSSDDQLRCEAIVGLSSAPDTYQALLVTLAEGENQAVSKAAARVLRLAGLNKEPQGDEPAEQKPPVEDLAAWHELLEQTSPDSPADPESGRRLFFSQVGPRCALCHQHGGRGARIGPDLTRLAETTSREKILASILQPSSEIAPRYTPWVLLTDEGKSLEGLKLPQGGDNGQETYCDPQGHLFTLRSEQIEQRQPSQVSIMPSGLEKTLSVQDLRDLLAFLAGNQQD